MHIEGKKLVCSFTTPLHHTNLSIYIHENKNSQECKKKLHFTKMLLFANLQMYTFVVFHCQYDFVQQEMMKANRQFD